jgi:anti-anti-sigma regulatory factor
MQSERPKVLKFEDPLDIPRNELHERFRESYEDDRIIIDLHGIELVNGAVLAELAKLRTHRNERGLEAGCLVIDSPYVRTALSAVGLERNWSVYQTLDEALESFEQRRRRG